MPDQFVRGSKNSKRLHQMLVLSGVLPDDELAVRRGIVAAKFDKESIPISVHLLQHDLEVVTINLNSVGYELGLNLNGKSVEVVGALCMGDPGESITPISFSKKEKNPPKEESGIRRNSPVCSSR